MGVYPSDVFWGQARRPRLGPLGSSSGWAHQAIPRHGCFPAEPASVSLGDAIV